MARVPSAKFAARGNTSQTSRALLPRNNEQQSSSKVRAHPSLMTTSQKNLQTMIEQHDQSHAPQQPPLAPVRDGRVTSQNARIANQTGSHSAFESSRKYQPPQTTTNMSNAPRKHQFAPTTRSNAQMEPRNSSS